MKRSLSWRSVRLFVLIAALLMSAQILVCTRGKHASKPRPVPVRHHELLSPQTYRYVINQPAACSDRSPFLVFMVPVAPHDAAARQAIRATWGAPREDTLTLFYAGLPGEASGLQDKLEDESRAHADIIQMSFQDTYRNLTIKTMMMMSWLATYCPNANYVMKVDADIFVNVFYLIRWLRSSPQQGFITGSVISDGRPRRGRDSKWYLSEEEYPEDSFPPFVSGAGYVLSADLAGRISWASRFVPMIPLEDVYVGLCLRVLGVRPVYSYSLPTFRNLFEIKQMEYNRCTFARRLIVNGFGASELLRVWEDFSKGHASC